MNQTFKVQNKQGEQLDVLVEGNPDSNITLVFVHGFGTDKNEGANLFLDISKPFLDRFRIVRFDFSSYGQSEGKQDDSCLSKLASDLDSVLTWVRDKFPGTLYLHAHSLGCFVTCYLSPDDIDKTLFSGIMSQDVEASIKRKQAKILERGGTVDENGETIYPRSSGDKQKIGSRFWRELREFDPIQKVKDFSNKTNLLVIHPLQDHIVVDDNIEDYPNIDSLQYVEINGDHAFSKVEDRQGLVEEMQKFFGV